MITWRATLPVFTNQKGASKTCMEIQSIGIVAATAAFMGIWFGHVAVRILEFRIEKLWMPIAGALVLGVSLEVWSLFTENELVAAATGILGMTFLIAYSFFCDITYTF